MFNRVRKQREKKGEAGDPVVAKRHKSQHGTGHFKARRSTLFSEKFLIFKNSDNTNIPWDSPIF